MNQDRYIFRDSSGNSFFVKEGLVQRKYYIDSDNCVWKEGDTKPLHCYEHNHKAAVAYLKALYAHMPNSEK